MRCALVLTALAATFAIGTCQFQFLHRRQGQDGGSFSSMTSWSFGQDGEMHKQTQSSSTESKEDGSVMTKRTVCKDGHCTEVIEVLEPPEPPPPTFQDAAGDAGFNPQPAWGPQPPILIDAGFNPLEGHMHPPAFAVMHSPQPFLEMQPPPPCATQMGAPLPMPEMQPQPALRGMLNRLIQNMHHQQPMWEEQQQHRLQRETERQSRMRAILDRLADIANQRPQEPREIMIAANGKGPEIILEPMPQGRLFGGAPPSGMIEIEISRPPPQYRAPAPKRASDMTYVKVGVAIVALGAAYALVMSALNLYRVSQVSARERPLRELGEPLAPDSVNVAIPGAASEAARKAAPIRMYLSSLYTRASAKTEAHGVKTYMARLYERILA